MNGFAMPSVLKNVEKHEGHHEGEETSGFGKGEAQDGVLEELTTEGRVAGDASDQRAEHSTDTDTSAGQTDGGNAGTLDLGSSNHGGGGRLSDDAAGLDDVAANVVGEGGAHGAEDEAVLGGLHCTLHARGALTEMH